MSYVADSQLLWMCLSTWIDVRQPMMPSKHAACRVSGVSPYFWASPKRLSTLGQQVFAGQVYTPRTFSATASASEKRAQHASRMLFLWCWLPEMG